MAKLFTLLLLLCYGAAAAAPRVITLAPNLTELAFAAGITPVAVSAYSDFPPAAAAIEQVANWQGINVERIISLKPDVVLAWREGNPQRQVDQLAAFGIKVVWLAPATIGEMIAAVRDLKIFSPHPQQADRQAAALQQQWDVLKKRYQHARKVSVFLQFGQRPLFTASRNTLQNEIVQLCGGENIFADSRVAWPQVSREQVLMRHPQAIVTGGDAAAVSAFWRPQLNAQVIVINDDWLSRPGPRILQAARALCSQLQP
ncbi:vitamin B12 ABC transporter substrate-binding protein BtuF [Erwinia sp. 198]|uniref:vitamin B12 ABC transporter substrate-binding protein BtuF n=1 Tax=Erwinia sp. 198 TaxID=2022746 RepID=UPI000F663D16|nr:vitamin B12 ABC transporter substrate-binding protein BtuF [Erwinia sp. 198]RRZ92275.1 vitamin B12 ABC transporter substrate-binding protein BtuF [Erwinia sp. 198]